MRSFSEIIDFLNKFCPPSLAFEWDNVGLIVGTDKKEVSKVLITLDVDEKVAHEAIETNADAIISHHPLMFNAIKRLTDKDPMQRTIAKLVTNGISLFSAHTNLDCVNGGLNDFLAQKLGIKDTEVIEVTSNINGIDHGLGRCGTVEDNTTLSDMLIRCTKALDTPFVRYVGDINKKIKTVAVNCGSGSDEIDILIKQNVDLFITGDVKYNPGRDCYENDMALIDAGHYETEHIVCELLFNILSKEFKDIEFFVSKSNKAVFNVFVK